MPLIQHRRQRRARHLSERELGSRLQYLADLQELTSQQQEVLVLRSRGTEAEAALSAIDETRARTVAEYRRSLFEELARGRAEG